MTITVELLHHLRRSSSTSRLACYRHRVFPACSRQFSLSPSHSSDGDDCDGETDSPKRRRRRVLQCGRARRKIESRRREDESFFSTKPNQTLESDDSLHKSRQIYHESLDVDTTNNKHAEERIDYNNTSTVLFGSPMDNPIRRAYIESQIKWKYPRTIEGWKYVLGRAWANYLWTWEGWLLPTKLRDEHGNIVEPEKEDESAKETWNEKAADAAGQISQNVQNNISTIQQEAPKLLLTAQKLTGISTKEELKQWASEQLKLGTECLTMFMKGYREGRDEEVDKMLHEYFKDEEKLNDTTSSEESEKEVTQQQLQQQDKPVEKEKPKNKIREERPWGRKERRRLKSVRNESQIADAEGS